MLGEKYKRILAKISEAIIPSGRYFDGGGERDAERIEGFLMREPSLAIFIKIILFSIEHLFTFKKFSSLSLERRREILKGWKRKGGIRGLIVEILSAMIKFEHFYDEDVYRRAGCIWNRAPQVVPDPPYRHQVRSADDFSNGEVIECEAVVVGSGAGGGVVAKELAERNIATVIVEEGRYWTRKDFTGQAVEAFRKFYRSPGEMLAFGNTVIGLPMGRMVGGSTAINTGTCWRTPEWILARWVKELKLTELSPEKLEPYFRRVEAILRVEEAKDEVIGGIKNVIARGCDALGFRYCPVRRNAPDCDAQGVCNFGCPTDARLSTNVSYIPDALRSGAMLMEETRADRILIERGKAVGIEVESVKTRKKLTIRSKVVILACGSIMTPALLLRQKLCNSSGLVGKNLTIHPGVDVGAFFENDDISPHKHTPQGYCIDSLHKEGILFLHAGLPIDTGAIAVPYIGEKFSEVMSGYEHTAWFGAMIEDSPSGRVLLFKGKPLVLYWLKKREIELLKKGVVTLSRIFLHAGAKYVFPPVRGIDELRSLRELDYLIHKRISARDFRAIVAFHPLGTCRMGIDPATSVVNTSHETWDIKNLYICDGSVVPTSIAVNPQETIMALATRAAEKIMEVANL